MYWSGVVFSNCFNCFTVLTAIMVQTLCGLDWTVGSYLEVKSYIGAVLKITGGAPEVHSDKSLLLLTFDI